MEYFATSGVATERSAGRAARDSNIMAVYSLAQSLRSTLGPMGMDKLIDNGFGDIIVTNDGYTLLSEMRITHPAARLAVEAAVAQQESVGDGTTTVVVLAGELLKQAQKLIEENVHPAVIGRGYRHAEKLVRAMLDEIARDVDKLGAEALRNVTMTAMTGKGPEASRGKLAELAVEAIAAVRSGAAGHEAVDAADIKLDRVVETSTEESELVHGVLFAGERAHPQMEREVRKARVGVIDRPIEIKNPEITAQIQIHDPAQMQAFVEQEATTLNEMVRAIEAAGCNVLFCQQNIEEPADYFLGRLGIFAVRRVPASDLVRIANATGARIVSSPFQISKEDLGSAGLVRETRKGKDTYIQVEQCDNPGSVTLLVKAGTLHAAEEARRSMEDAIGDLVSVVTRRKVLPGAGAVEMEIARRLKAEAKRTLSGKGRLVVEAFAEALKIVPRTLVESAGVDTTEYLAQFEERQEKEGSGIGFDLLTGEFADCWKAGIIEPLELKVQAIGSATEVAAMILRIDEIHIGETPEK